MKLNVEKNVLMISKKYNVEKEKINILRKINFLFNYSENEGIKLIDNFFKKEKN